MTPREQRELEERMHSLEGRDLLRIVAVDASDYRPEALAIAREELRQRRLDVLTKKQYWELFPAERISSDGFCATCLSQTTDESPGDTTVVNFIFGVRLIGHDDRCAVCGSVLQTMWLQCILPIIPLGRYRIIYLESGLLSGRYIGRKIRK